MVSKRKAERLTLPFPARLSHFRGVDRTCIVYRNALATFVIHAFRGQQPLTSFS